ncbi:MAG TPA: aldo/keto reductase [Methanocella sp.]|nr:aldo/keto reductase [Methanocella sp.]
MRYKKTKNCGEELSILGFGCMRLPATSEGKVDRPQAIQLIRYGIDHGINYLDSAYVYHGGESETILGEALLDGYREKANIATKLPTWFIRKQDDMDRYLDEQLKRLQTDHIDFYLIHGLGKDRWDHITDLGVAEFLDDALADGRIRYAGFSYHDSPDNFKNIVDGYEWTFAQIQYNFMDEDYQAGTVGLKYAAYRGLDVVVMEPLKGGMLTRPVPAIDEIRAEANGRTAASFGLQWVWDHPEVDVVLSGMSTIDQLKENLKYADESNANRLTSSELALIERMRTTYRERTKVECTRCEYCMPCPFGVDIPGCLGIYNNSYMYDDTAQMKMVYNTYMAEGCASKCTECGECEEKCPQRLPIRETLQDIATHFGK